MWKFIYVCLFGVLTACGGTAVQKAVTQERMRTVEADYQRCFRATADYIHLRGFRIARMDEDKGVIESDYKEGAGWGNTFAGDERAKVLAQVARVDSTHTRIVLDLISEVRDTYSGWQPVELDISMEQIAYTRFFEGIMARAEGRSIR